MPRGRPANFASNTTNIKNYQKKKKKIASPLSLTKCREDVSKVSCRNADVERLAELQRTDRYQSQVAVEVIRDLRNETTPIDRIRSWQKKRERKRKRKRKRALENTLKRRKGMGYLKFLARTAAGVCE